MYNHKGYHNGSRALGSHLIEFKNCSQLFAVQNCPDNSCNFVSWGIFRT